MNVLAEIKQMSLSEKLITMEQLWNELQNSEEGVQSPPWHKEVLKAREGKEKFVNWNDAKKSIRNSCR
ncbi:hypothetical protein LNTAR_02579 [Lentisphaera araneosa HTCC2155]|uniref:Addiction module component n=1 Tax=Lentisphaera araneosa HTCC2155 TaxID=313628 RepID=A6DUJ9_9BACT|nr:addiction module protein [Lentisphaera araneosa]EDM24689.1 hypothetical protein LNTAR_02579 [Lentisphaera araneosa HTCC2155]